MHDLLQLLEQDARLAPAEIATRLGLDVAQVEAMIAQAEASGALLGYSALVNWAATDSQKVYAFIEVEAIPEHDKGFDAIAEHIALFDEVHSAYLMSGTSDLQVVVEGEDFREIARFVAEKLAPIPGVKRTSTSFVLKTYKLEGRAIQERKAGGRLAVTP